MSGKAKAFLLTVFGEPVRGESVYGRVGWISSKFMALLDSPELMSLLQGLPLAINQAGAYIRTTGISVLAYIKVYNEVWRKLMETQHRFASQGPLDRIFFNDLGPSFRRSRRTEGSCR